MTRITLIISLFICQLIFSQQSLSKLTEKYTPYLSELNQDIGILVHKNGKTEVASIGTRNYNQHTVFNIGSATKKITAILILQELEKGNLNLSDSIGVYLQPIKNVDSSLTIESLLRHRSGLGELVGKNFESDFYAKSDSIYNSNPLDRIPENNSKKIGKYSYCNTNYILLGKILESITDKSYFDLVRERIFIPCNMTESYPYVSKKLKNLATPIHKGQDATNYLDYRFFASYANAAGSIASTLHDMAKFYNHLFQTKTLISNSSLQKLIDFDDADYGLGMIKFKNGFVGHGGNNLGYSFREYYNPITKNMILFFGNSRFIPFNKMLKEELFAYLKDENKNITFNQNITTHFKKTIGKYLFDSHGMKMEIEILKKNNHLYFSAQGAEVILISKEDNKLYNGAFGVELELNPENTNQLVFRQNGLETTIKRIKS